MIIKMKIFIKKIWKIIISFENNNQNLQVQSRISMIKESDIKESNISPQ